MAVTRHQFGQDPGRGTRLQHLSSRHDASGCVMAEDAALVVALWHCFPSSPMTRIAFMQQ